VTTAFNALRRETLETEELAMFLNPQRRLRATAALRRAPQPRVTPALRSRGPVDDTCFKNALRAQIYGSPCGGAWAADSTGRMPALADAVSGYVNCITVFGHREEAGERGTRELAARLDGRKVKTILRFLDRPATPPSPSICRRLLCQPTV
jgi:hypothetical protein